jgi:transposase
MARFLRPFPATQAVRKQGMFFEKEFLKTEDNLSILNYLRSVPMKFISAHFDQLMLLPPDITEKIPAGHKCFFIRNIVHELDLTSLVSEYSEEGRPAYHPEIILSLLFCAYSDGLTRARAIAHKTRTDVVYMYLGIRFSFFSA